MAKIIFKSNRNTVTCNTYVAHELYKRNEVIINKLGGEIIRGEERFTAKFKTAAKAKEFVEQAITSISKKEYNACRKTEPKKVAPARGKGKSEKTVATKGKDNFITLTDDDGNTYKVPMSALGMPKTGKGSATPKKAVATTKKKAVTKGKGKSKQLTERQKQHTAYEMTNAAFKKKVSYKTWKAKYNKILASL